MTTRGLLVEYAAHRCLRVRARRLRHVLRYGQPSQEMSIGCQARFYRESDAYNSDSGTLPESSARDTAGLANEKHATIGRETERACGVASAQRFAPARIFANSAEPLDAISCEKSDVIDIGAVDNWSRET